MLKLKTMSFSALAFILTSFLLFLNLYLITQNLALEMLGLYGLANTLANSTRIFDIFGSRALSFEIAEKQLNNSTNLLFGSVVLSIIVTGPLTLTLSLYYLIPKLTTHDFNQYFEISLYNFIALITLSVPTAAITLILKSYLDGLNLSSKRAQIEILGLAIAGVLIFIFTKIDLKEHLLFIPFYVNLIQMILLILFISRSIKAMNFSSLRQDMLKLFKRSFKIQSASVLNLPIEFFLKSLILQHYGAFNLGLFEVIQRFFNALRGLLLSVYKALYHDLVQNTLELRVIGKATSLILISYIFILPIVHLVITRGIGLTGNGYLMLFLCAAATYGAHILNLGIYLISEAKGIHRFNFYQTALIATFLMLFAQTDAFEFNLYYWPTITILSIAIFSLLNLSAYLKFPTTSRCDINNG